MRAALLALAACSHAPPAAWPVPQGWKAEVIPFPIDFAPQLAHRGVEVIRFAPGFFDPAAPGYWSYVFAWRTDDAATLDAPALAAELTTYFRGLVAAVDDKHRIADADRAKIEVRVSEQRGRLPISADMYDPFKTGAWISLEGVASRHACDTGALWVIVLTPVTSMMTNGIRDQLDQLARGATCDNVHR